MLLLPPSVYCLNKPQGGSSRQLVGKFKKEHLGKIKKIGHFGTLDPFANGLLLVGVNGAQKLNNYVHDCLSKTYIARGVFGMKTPTGDMTVEACDKQTEDDLKEKLLQVNNNVLLKSWREKFIGDYWQAPPMYSAAKFEGRPLYKWAREGTKIEKEAKLRKIYSLDVLQFSYPEVVFKVEVSSGTYIRTLFEDMALCFNCLGTLKNLERTRIGAITLGDFDESTAVDLITLIPWPIIELTERQERSFRNGMTITFASLAPAVTEHSKHMAGLKHYWIKSEAGQLIGAAHESDEKLRVTFNLK